MKVKDRINLPVPSFFFLTLVFALIVLLIPLVLAASCPDILSVSASKTVLDPNENFICKVKVEERDRGVHCGIAKNNEWVRGCVWSHWEGKTAIFDCKAPSNPGTYDLIGYNFRCETPDAVKQITVVGEEEEEFDIDVFDVDVSPSSVDEGDDVTVSGKVELVEAPSGSHTVTIKWFIDGDLEETETESMHEGDTVSVSETFDTSGLDDGTHTAKIRATVDAVSDQDSDTFNVNVEEEEEQDLRLGSLDVSPSTICRSEDELIEFSIPVTLERGEDDTEVLAQFSIEDNNGGFFQADSQRRNLDEGETKTFTGSFDYDANRFDLGSHDVKVTVENGDRETEFSVLRVVSCPAPSQINIDVGVITLNPPSPKQGDLVTSTVPVRLLQATLPKTVQVSAYIDGGLLTTSTLQYNSLTTLAWQFTIDTNFYTTGTHTVEVRATADGSTFTSLKVFSISPITPITPRPLHCLSVDDILVDGSLKAGEGASIKARVSNCGSSIESSVQTRLDAFNTTKYLSAFSLGVGQNKDVTFSLTVPENVRGVAELKVTASNPNAGDVLIESFPVLSGVPLLSVRPEYRVNVCEVNKVRFDVVNTGEIRGTFTLVTSGQYASWVSGLPTQVTLESQERRSFDVFVNVPCDVQPSLYTFTLEAVSGVGKHASTVGLRAGKPFEFPFALPTGLFARMPEWLPWLIGGLVVLFAVALYYVYGVKTGRIKVRWFEDRRVPEYFLKNKRK